MDLVLEESYFTIVIVFAVEKKNNPWWRYWTLIRKSLFIPENRYESTYTEGSAASSRYDTPQPIIGNAISSWTVHVKKKADCSAMFRIERTVPREKMVLIGKNVIFANKGVLELYRTLTLAIISREVSGTFDSFACSFWPPIVFDTTIQHHVIFCYSVF